MRCGQRERGSSSSWVLSGTRIRCGSCRWMRVKCLEWAFDSDETASMAWSSIKLHLGLIWWQLNSARLCEPAVGTMCNGLRAMPIIDFDIVFCAFWVSTSNPIKIICTSNFHNFLGIWEFYEPLTAEIYWIGLGPVGCLKASIRSCKVPSTFWNCKISFDV